MFPYLFPAPVPPAFLVISIHDRRPAGVRAKGLPRRRRPRRTGTHRVTSRFDTVPHRRCVRCDATEGGKRAAAPACYGAQPLPEILSAGGGAVGSFLPR